MKTPCYQNPLSNPLRGTHTSHNNAPAQHTLGQDTQTGTQHSFIKTSSLQNVIKNMCNGIPVHLPTHATNKPPLQPSTFVETQSIREGWVGKKSTIKHSHLKHKSVFLIRNVYNEEPHKSFSQSGCTVQKRIWLFWEVSKYLSTTSLPEMLNLHSLYA